MLSDFPQIAQTGHRTVFVHDLDQRAAGSQSGHPRQVDHRFGMTRTAEHPFVTRPERENMPRTAQIGRLGGRIDQRPHRSRTVGRSHAGRTTVSEQIDRHRERRTEQRRIVGNLHLQIQFPTAVFGQRSAQHAAAVVKHEIDDLRGDLFAGDDKIAFVLPILVIDHDDDFARADIFDRFVHTAENLFVVLFL